MSIVNGNNLRTIRTVYRLSREELGALMDVSGRFVAFVERGDRTLPQKRAELLAHKLALTPEKLARITEIYERSRNIDRPAAEIARLW